jgi:hypothetical protein
MPKLFLKWDTYAIKKEGKAEGDELSEILLWSLTTVSLGLGLFPWICYFYYERKEKTRKYR